MVVDSMWRRWAPVFVRLQHLTPLLTVFWYIGAVLGHVCLGLGVLAWGPCCSVGFSCSPNGALEFVLFCGRLAVSQCNFLLIHSMKILQEQGLLPPSRPPHPRPALNPPSVCVAPWSVGCKTMQFLVHSFNAISCSFIQCNFLFIHSFI